MKKKTIYLVSLLMISMLALAGCSSSGTTTKKVGTAPDGSEVAIEKATMKFMNDTIAGDYKIVSTEELNQWVKDGKDMIIIDTMPASSFKDGHIPGAFNAELPKTSLEDTTDEQRAAFVKLLGDNKDKTIVVYCGFVGCARSDVGAVIAKEEGFKNVYRQPGGIIAWQEAGYETEK